MPDPLALYYESSFCFDSLSYNNHRVSSQPDTHTPTIRSQYPFVYKTNSFFPAALLRLLTKENDDQHTVRAPTPLLSLFLSILPSVSVFVSVSQTKKQERRPAEFASITTHPLLSLSRSLSLSRTPSDQTTVPVRPQNQFFVRRRFCVLKKKEYDDRPASQAPPDTLLSLLSRTSPDKTPYTAQRVAR